MTKKTLNMSILERFMTAQELGKLLETYDSNKKQMGQGNRFKTLQREVTQQEKDMIVDYFNADLALSDIGKKYDVNQDKVRNTVYNAGIRLVYQNLSKFGI